MKEKSFAVEARLGFMNCKTINGRNNSCTHDTIRWKRLQIFNDQSIFANSIASIWSHKNLKIVPKTK